MMKNKSGSFLPHTATVRAAADGFRRAGASDIYTVVRNPLDRAKSASLVSAGDRAYHGGYHQWLAVEAKAMGL